MGDLVRVASYKNFIAPQLMPWDNTQVPSIRIPLHASSFWGAVFSVELSKKSTLNVSFVDEFSNGEWTTYDEQHPERIYSSTISNVLKQNRPKAKAHKFGYYRKRYRRNGVNEYAVLTKNETGSFAPNTLKLAMYGMDENTTIRRIIWAGVYSPYTWLIPHLVTTYNWI